MHHKGREKGHFFYITGCCTLLWYQGNIKLRTG